MKVPVPVIGRTQPSKTGLAYQTAEGATPEAFGAGIGRALTGVGGAIVGVGDLLKQNEEQLDRFNGLTRLSEYEQKRAERLVELKKNAPPDGKGFTRMVEEDRHETDADFLNSLPPHLQPQFQARLAA